MLQPQTKNCKWKQQSKTHHQRLPKAWLSRNLPRVKKTSRDVSEPWVYESHFKWHLPSPGVRNKIQEMAFLPDFPGSGLNLAISPLPTPVLLGTCLDQPPLSFSSPPSSFSSLLALHWNWCGWRWTNTLTPKSTGHSPHTKRNSGPWKEFAEEFSLPP